MLPKNLRDFCMMSVKTKKHLQKYKNQGEMIL